MDSWISIYKPRSFSSAQIVSMVKKNFPKVKIGHAGTLDPEAEGVLPIAIGEATKLINFLMDAKKEYVFTIQFGARTDTGDSAGRIIETCKGFPAREDCYSVLENFKGEISQTPPLYSAIKIKGRRAYDLARAGIDFTISSRKIHIYDIKLEDFSQKLGTAKIRVICSKGTYVRSLAEDIALSLKNLGYVIELRRTKVGVFNEEESIDISDFVQGDWLEIGPLLLDGAKKPEIVLDDIPVLDVNRDEAYKVKCGQKVVFDGRGLSENELVWLRYEGRLLAVGELCQGVFVSKRVFNISSYQI